MTLASTGSITAAILLPFADRATPATNCPAGTPGIELDAHEVPELVEIHTKFVFTLGEFKAAIVVPSADMNTSEFIFVGPVWVQVWADAELATSPP